ncbi:hypothetical protein AMELA_G00107770 [Ameiurus melas]|uniref:Uncharacterized protein n=1 Tax=Ameiurus melas TaxID=219545 RepID=A0A7J6AR40_AMEME|nr:hypothetical protein AMELA_G00107770 [Ameiurus melas]
MTSAGPYRQLSSESGPRFGCVPNPKTDSLGWRCFAFTLAHWNFSSEILWTVVMDPEDTFRINLPSAVTNRDLL